MKNFTELKNLAMGNFGLITAAQARELGISRVELSRWVQKDWLEQVSRGVYRMSEFPPSALDPFAAATEAVGPDARIVGESVLGMLELTSTNPAWIQVGTPRRIRRRLGKGISVVSVPVDAAVEWYEGVRSQSVYEAIRMSIGKVPPDRLREAVANGYAKGYLQRDDCRRLKKEIGYGDTSEYGVS